MKAKILVYALLALVLATIHVAEAQQAKKVPGNARDQTQKVLCYPAHIHHRDN